MGILSSSNVAKEPPTEPPGSSFRRPSLDVYHGNEKRRSSSVQRTSHRISLPVSAKKIPFAKWSRKLFGSEKAVRDEQIKTAQAGRFVIHPYSTFRFYWDLVTCVVIVANVSFIPIDIAFIEQRHDFGGFAFKLLSDIWFLLDIIFNFRTGIVVEDEADVELRVYHIQKHYLTTWFFLDLICSFPFDFLFTLGSRVDKTVGVVQLLRIGKILAIVRIARILRLVRTVHHWEEVFNLQYDLTVSVLRLFNMILMNFFLCHLNACLLYFVPYLYDFPDNSWVSLSGLFLPNKTLGEVYSWALFKSTSHMLGIGYSQSLPKNLPDVWVTIWSQFTGGVLFVGFIGSAITIMEDLDHDSNAYKLKRAEIGQYLAFRKIPLDLKRRVLDYFDNRCAGRTFREKEMLEELNPALRQEIVWYNTSQLICSVRLFYDTSDNFVLEIGEHLKFAVYTPGDMIVKIGRKANSMYFIQRGMVSLSPPDNETALILSDGMYFGETCILQAGFVRTVSAQAVCVSYVYSLKRKDFNKVLRKYPDDKAKIKFRITETARHSMDIPVDTFRNKRILSLIRDDAGEYYPEELQPSNGRSDESTKETSA